MIRSFQVKPDEGSEPIPVSTILPSVYGTNQLAFRGSTVAPFKYGFTAARPTTMIQTHHPPTPLLSLAVMLIAVILLRKAPKILQIMRGNRSGLGSNIKMLKGSVDLPKQPLAP